MIRLMVCDDHEVVRDGIKLIASETDDIRVVGEAGTAKEGLDMALKHDYDVVLLDISLPDRSGLEVLKELVVRKPRIKILVLSMHPEDQYAVRVLKAGAQGYLTKGSASTELAEAVRRVASGRKYITASASETLVRELGAPAADDRHKEISDREYQVMCLLASGKFSREIAEELFLSINTVKTYRSRVMRKMGFRNNADLVRYVVEHRLDM